MAIQENLDTEQTDTLMVDLTPSPTLVSRVAKLILGVTLLSLALFPFFVSGDLLLLVMLSSGTFCLLYLGVWILAQRGKPRIAAWLFIFGTWSGQMAGILATGKLSEQASVSVVNVILATGFMLGRRPAIGVSLFCISTMGIGAWLVNTGIIPSSGYASSEAVDGVSLLCVLMGSVGVTYIGIEFMLDAVQRAHVSAKRVGEAMIALEEARVIDTQRANRAERLGLMARNMVGLVEADALTQEVSIGLRDTIDAWIVLIIGRGGRLHAAAGLGEEEPPLEVLTDTWEHLVEQGGCKAVDDDTLEQLSKDLNIEKPTTGVASRGPHTPIMVVVLTKNEKMALQEVVWPIQIASSLLDAAMIRHESERRLIQAQKMDALNRLSSGIAHDFNNLLTTILGGAELIQHNDDVPDVVHGHLRRVQEAGERAASLTAKLMTFTRGAPQERRIMEVGALITDLSLVLRRTVEESIQLEYHIPEEPLWIDADAIAIEQVIFHLVANAREAVGGSGRVDIGFEHRAPGGREKQKAQAVIWVQDNGEGMDLSTRARVFEPFFTTRKGKGATGLGLSVVYGVAQALGGDVFVDSTRGTGTCVEVHLPAALEPVELPVADTPIAKPIAGERVLVVEDDPDVRETVCEMLRLGGYVAEQAGSGEDALAVLSSGAEYQLVLSDVIMPSMSGFELARELRERELMTPIALISGYAPTDRSTGDEQVELPRITKPFSLRELLSFVGRAIVHPE